MLVIWLILIPTFLAGQLNLHPSTPKEINKLKKRVLNNTDHSYFGFEIGMLLNMGSTTCITPGFEGNLNNDAVWEMPLDYVPAQNFKLFAGYAHKNHRFEVGFGALKGKIRVQDYGYLTHFGNLTLRYYYGLPIKSNIFKLLVGPEIGFAFRMPIDGLDSAPYVNYYIQQGNYYPLTGIAGGSPFFKMSFGINARLDIKLAKNLTFIFQTNLGTAVPNGAYFRFSPNPGFPQFDSEYKNSIINLNINVGLKFDFFSEKNKQKTYDALGIKDPYKK